MNITNPPGTNTVTATISNFPAPPTTPVAISVTSPQSGSPAKISGNAKQLQLLVSNLDSTQKIFVQDKLASTVQIGSLVGPLATGVFDLQTTVQVSTTSGSAVAVTALSIRST